MEPVLNANPQLAAMKEALELGLQQDGITYHGWVGHDRLLEATANAGLYLYPTSYPETSCISLMRAQALGAIPVTSRHLESAVPETAVWDIGPTSALHWKDDASGASQSGYLPMSANATAAAEWAEVVIDAMRVPPVELMQHRAKMMEWAATKFSWENVAKQWLSWIDPSSALRNSPKAASSLYIPWIAYGGNVDTDHALALMKLLEVLRKRGIDVKVDAIVGESLIARARNIAASRFVHSHHTHLLFVDADIAFNELDVLDMMALDKEVIAGAYRLKTDDVLWAFDGSYSTTETPGLYRAAWPTTGFMMIARRALEKIARAHPERAYKNHIPSYEIVDVFDYFPAGLQASGLYVSEDFGFASLCHGSGVETFIYGKATLSHVGKKAYVGNLHALTVEKEAAGQYTTNRKQPSR
eukprot:TRINITY_DN122017_c0_g1_i1.p1 TRINITY_DN122017_c0_g1~~TRINITY_DN122017_c0_g1_i1.p1  ORF type:complete len:481 (+),score=66.68 TRINITY_DN122017_c0_g1_i1:202-1443(+)